MNSQLSQPDRGEMEELQKTYFDAISRTNRFIVSTLILLIILATVVVQELREHNNKVAGVGKELRTVDANLKLLENDLKESHEKLRKFLTGPITGQEIRNITHLQLQNLPKPIAIPRDPNYNNQLTDIENALTGLSAKSEKEPSTKPASNEEKSPEAGSLDSTDVNRSEGCIAVVADIETPKGLDGYDLRLRPADPADGLLKDRNLRNLLIVTLVGTDLHIRIFDANGKRVVDKAENELISGEKLEALKQQLNPLPDESRLSQEQKQKFIRDAILILVHGKTQAVLDCAVHLVDNYKDVYVSASDALRESAIKRKRNKS